MLQEQFTTILENGNPKKLIPFLQSLTVEQKKQLVPHIKKLSNEYLKTHAVRIGTITTYNHKATSAQENILQISSFVCMNRSDFNKTQFPIQVLEEKLLRIIVDWYCPSWFSDFVNEQAGHDFILHWLTYNWVMELTEKGHLKPSKELIAKLLIPSVFENKDNVYSFKPENLLTRKITLEEHIWYLFEVEANQHYSDRFLHFGSQPKDKIGWLVLFRQYVAENRLDRFRVLKESLLASNRNFNKVLSGWFSQLFIELEPAKEEVLRLQKELFSVLSSPHSKAVNTSLNEIKKILTEKEFDATSFLDAVPVLLSSDVKATTTAVSAILEKLAQTLPAHREKISLLLCQVFLHADDDLQSRAAKTIAKYGDVKNTGLKQELAGFYPNMMTTAKQLLANFFDTDSKTEKAATTEEETLRVDNSFTTLAEIQLPANVDDLVFLASQAFDNNEPWHIDILPAALIQFRPLLKPEDLSRFEPAFQRAIGTASKGLRSTNGYLDHLLAMFFIDFGHWLIRNFPTAVASIENVYRKYDQKNGDVTRSWLAISENSSYTAEWTTYKKLKAYEPYQLLLLAVLDKIKSGNDLPLLSTPTYTHGWISPAALIDRLYAYQQAGQKPVDIDLQIAISRCYVKNAGEGLDYAAQRLTGELRDLMLFLLDEKAEPKGLFHNKAAWMVASLTKKEKKQWKQLGSFPGFKNYTGQLEWQSVESEYSYQTYDSQVGKLVPATRRRKKLEVLKEGTIKESGSKKPSSDAPPASKADDYMLYDLLVLKSNYTDSEHNDIRRLLSLVPGNPAPLLVDIINICLHGLYSFSEADKKLVSATLQVLYETWDDPGEMEYLFLGTCMLVGDKTIANIAGELWLRAVPPGKIDNVRLGKIIGVHERIEYAPLKRLTDLLGQNLFNISTLHNRQLQILVANILIELPDEPVKNLKKLLEIYNELLSVTNSSITEGRIPMKLEAWQKNAGVQKITQVLMKRKSSI